MKENVPEREARLPVIVEINTGCNHQGGGETDIEEVDRDEWEAMSPKARAKYLDSIADEYANNRFAWGWHIRDEADMKMIEE